MATSRCFGLRRVDTHVMVPIVDMIDHALDPNCGMQTSSRPAELGVGRTGPDGEAEVDGEDVGLFVTRKVW